jgi:hypothetical protein
MPIFHFSVYKKIEIKTLPPFPEGLPCWPLFWLSLTNGGHSCTLKSKGSGRFTRGCSLGSTSLGASLPISQQDCRCPAGVQMDRPRDLSPKAYRVKDRWYPLFDEGSAPNPYAPFSALASDKSPGENPTPCHPSP